jgi:hypothetical protein
MRRTPTMYRKLAAFADRTKSTAIAVAAALGAGLIAPAVMVASPPAYAKPAPGPAAACNYFYEWLGKVRFPLQPDPHAAYTYVAVSNQAGRDGVAFLVRGDFVHAAWTSWMAYTGAAKPFSVANFVNNPPANSNNPVGPNAGSIDPFADGQPMRGTPRAFTLLFTPKGYRGRIAPTLAGVPTASIPKPNVQPYPTAKRGNRGSGDWALANRVYAALRGYNPGGTTKDTFPTVTAVKLSTGKAVDCQKYNVLPDRLQTPPTNPPDALNYGHVPTRIVLKNGSVFTGVDVAGPASAEISPPNPKGFVVFTRPPLAPGADVSTTPPPDNCSGYLGSSLDPKSIALIRIPHVANYTDTTNVTPSTRYPNPVNPSERWQTAYESVNMYGNSPGLYLPGDPNTSTIADGQFQMDSSGGSTFIVWPRTLSPRAKNQVISYAARQGWPLIRSGTQSPLTGANLLFRIKASASDYYGSMTAVPCFYGTGKRTQHKGTPWSGVPVGAAAQPSQYVATAKNMGLETRNGVISAAPQGVTCSSVADLASGKCLTALKKYIKDTGGSYFAP